MGQVTEPRPSCYLALLSGDNKTRQQRRQPQLRDLTNIVCEKGAFLFQPHLCLIRLCGLILVIQHNGIE